MVGMVWVGVMVFVLPSSSESYQPRGALAHPMLSSPPGGCLMLRRILDKQQDVLLAEERRLLGELAVALARFDAAAEDQGALERSVRQLDELFLLVVAGEFNAGKSAFVNALLGSRVLEEGVTPTTTRVQIVKYGATVARTTTEAALDVVTAPVDLLSEINIVDT